MAYPKLKLDKTEVVLNPSLVKLVKEQVPGQLKAMTFSEMVEFWNAVKELLNVPVLAKLARMFKQ